MTRAALVIALLGAECTGKTTLAIALGDALSAGGCDVAVIPEYLREFCVQHRRTPTACEQSGIANEQTLRISEAALNHEIVVADTTALMTAVYSEQVFEDRSLYSAALLLQLGYQLTLVTAADIPWFADGHQRAGTFARERVDKCLRVALAGAQIPYVPISGGPESRLARVLVEVAWLTAGRYG